MDGHWWVVRHRVEGVEVPVRYHVHSSDAASWWGQEHDLAKVPAALRAAVYPGVRSVVSVQDLQRSLELVFFDEQPPGPGNRANEQPDGQRDDLDLRADLNGEGAAPDADEGALHLQSSGHLKRVPGDFASHLREHQQQNVVPEAMVPRVHAGVQR